MHVEKVWAIGDLCWTALPGEKGLWAGRIVQIIITPAVTKPLHLIKMQRRDWPHIECRDALLLTPDEGDAPPYTPRVSA